MPGAKNDYIVVRLQQASTDYADAAASKVESIYTDFARSALAFPQLIAGEAKLPREHDLPRSVAPKYAALLDLKSFRDVPRDAQSSFS